MDSEFWTNTWQAGRIGFHMGDVNPVLQAHLAELVQDDHACVLVPLCGKSHDLRWLSSQGHDVIGVEWVAQAVAELFEEVLDEVAERQRVGPYESWRVPGLCVLNGDMFALDAAHLPRRPTAVWDRASLVAISPDRREEFVEVVRRVVAPGGRVLLNVFDYDQDEMSGPPFSVPEREVRRLFAGCTLTLLHRKDGSAMFKDNPDRNVTRFDIDTWLIELP